MSNTTAFRSHIPTPTLSGQHEPVWNAGLLSSVYVDPTAPTDGQCLIYDATNDEYVPGLVADVELADGTAAAPSLRFANDLDTGLYWAAANTIGFSAAGVSQMTLSDTALTVNGIYVGSVTTLTATGGGDAIPLTHQVVAVTSQGAGDALTLAAGTVGQTITILYVAEGAGTDTLVITPSSLVGYTTSTLSAVGDSVVLVYTSSGWAAVGGVNPVLA